jgi:hypothetical protein
MATKITRPKQLHGYEKSLGLSNNMATKAMCMTFKVSGSLLDVSLWASSGPPERLIRSVGIRYNENTRCLKHNIEGYSTLIRRK